VPKEWITLVNEPITTKELDRLRTCIRRGRPYGDQDWVALTAKRLGLDSSMRSAGRPKNEA
jgi:putative transposase